MARYLVLTFIVYTRIFLASSGKTTCGPNEVARQQNDNSSDRCPQSDQNATPYQERRASACKCDVMYLRAANGTCIRARDCPPIPCGENEKFDSCPNTFCSENCTNASPDGNRCRNFFGVGPVVICRPACRCIDKYWRNEDNKCVAYDKCFTPTCGPNEVARQNNDISSDSCPQPACQSTTNPEPRYSACKCDIQYLRAANGTCIRARDCPAIPCAENEVFDSCPNPFCLEQCSNASPPSSDGQRCRFIGRIDVAIICRPACRCINDYWRNENNECVYYNECTQFQQPNCD